VVGYQRTTDDVGEDRTSIAGDRRWIQKASTVTGRVGHGWKRKRTGSNSGTHSGSGMAVCMAFARFVGVYRPNEVLSTILLGSEGKKKLMPSCARFKTQISSARKRVEGSVNKRYK
jgi:hypothetical protein